MAKEWETPQDRWQKKAGYKVKGFKLKQELILNFDAACKKAGTTPTTQVREMMEDFINKNR